MRFSLLLLGLAFLLNSCNMNIKMADAPFTLDSLMTYDYQGLEKLFGKEKLKDSLVQANGQPIRYTLVMPGTKAAVQLQWTDTSRVSIDYATISGTASAWKTRDSVTLGMSMVELEKINEAPFYFYNDGPNVNALAYHELKEPTEPGYVWLWAIDGETKSKLSGRLDKVKLNPSIKFPADGNQLDNIIASNNPKAIENNPIVIEVTLSRFNIPLKISIEDVVITRTANIPHATSNRTDDRVNKINQVILEYFDLESFEPATDFAWSNLSFETEMDENTIAIHLKGTYMGPYPSEIDDVLFISKSGYKMDAVDIPFYTLFKHDSYFNFLDKYWNEKCEAAMAKAVQCAEAQPSCSCLDMKVSFANGNIVLSTTGDCYPHAAEACNPEASVQIPVKDLTPYLSDFGKQIVVGQDYYNKTALQQFNISSEYRYKLPNVMFIEFNIVNAQDSFEGNMAMAGLQLIPGDDPFYGKIEGWFSYKDLEGKPARIAGEFDESGSLSMKDLAGDITGTAGGNISFQFKSKGGEQYDPSQGYELTGEMDGFMFEVKKVLYSGFRFYEPRGD